MLENFVDVVENKTEFDLNEMIVMCKRKNNKKRDFLFVNTLQGKHIPKNPSKINELYNNFFDEINKNILLNEKIIIVGFAETATALSQFVAMKLSLVNENFVYYLQTTREIDETKTKLFDFLEEHSHAASQFFYCNDELPYFDRVVFIEDEITTGKTILNFVDNFKNINANAKYTVASILNWQNERDFNEFQKNGIDINFLVRGSLKENIKPINLTNVKQAKNYFDCENKDVDVINASLDVTDFRYGADPTCFKNLNDTLNKLKGEIEKIVCENDKVAVVGTEEFMFLPMFASLGINCNIVCRATTRSPIEISEETAIFNGIKLSSAYEKNRGTYLYNLDYDYDKIIVVTEKKCEKQFKNAFKSFCDKHSIKLYIIEI